MRKVISESLLNQIISRNVRITLNESFFPQMDDEPSGMLNDRGDANIEEKSKAKRHKDDDNSGSSKKKSSKLEKKRAFVISWLKDPAVNCAEIMRKLWHPQKNEEDAARSYFYKCRDGKANESGNPCRFSDDEIVKLFSIHSGQK